MPELSLDFFVTSTIYGARTREPYVGIEWRGQKIQVSPEEARRMGMLLIEAGQAALLDAFLVEWVMEIGIDLPQASTVLGEFRVWRGRRADEQSEGDQDDER